MDKYKRLQVLSQAQPTLPLLEGLQTYHRAFDQSSDPADLQLAYYLSGAIQQIAHLQYLYETCRQTETQAIADLVERFEQARKKQ